MATIVTPPKKKRIGCNQCEAIFEYLPEEVEEKHFHSFWGGVSGGYKRVKCPREKCPGYGYIEKW
jgi:hypothetical protein